MGNPHHPVNYPNDAYPVRPGTSDALTARTIDATVHPPLVRAQETVATIGPRFIETVVPLATSPLFLSMIALTLIFLWVAIRARFRPGGLVVGAVIVMTLTSFRPLRLPPPAPVAPSRAELRVADSRRPHTVVRGDNNRYFPTPPDMIDDVPAVTPPEYEPPAPLDADGNRVYWSTPDVPLPPTAPYDVQMPGGRLIIPRVPITAIPEAEVSMKLLRSAERMARQNDRIRQMVYQLRENEELQAMMEQLRAQMREEIRRRRPHRVAVRY
jgi:hypothetical protein